jgi:hypothetical protein
MESTTVACDLPEYAGTGYGSTLVGIPAANTALFTYFRGKAAARLVRVRCDTADVEIIKGVSGMLVDGALMQRHAYLLSENALHEYDVERSKIVRRLKMPAAMHRVYHVAPGVLAVGRYWSSVTLFVDIKSWSVVSRIALPTDHFLHRGAVVLACSFQGGTARELDPSYRSTSTKLVIIPLARDMAVSANRMFAIKGPPTPGAVAEPLRATVLMRMHAETFAVEAEREIIGIERILGVDPNGLVILRTATGVGLADPVTLALVAEHHVAERITAMARVGERAVAFTGNPQFVAGIRVCRWAELAA